MAAQRWKEPSRLSETDPIPTLMSPAMGWEVLAKLLNLLSQNKPKNGTYLTGWLRPFNKYTAHQTGLEIGRCSIPA